MRTTACGELGAWSQAHTERRLPREADRSPIAMLEELPSAVLLERLPVPILAVADSAAVVFTNEAFAEMLGRSRETLSSLTLHHIFPSMQRTDSALCTFREWAGLIVNMAHADGSVVRARMSRSVLLRCDDPVLAVTFRDLTEEIWTNPRAEQWHF